MADEIVLRIKQGDQARDIAGVLTSGGAVIIQTADLTAHSLLTSLTQAITTGLKVEIDDVEELLTQVFQRLTSGITVQIDQSTHEHVYREVPSGSIDGTNMVFTTARGYITNSLKVFVHPPAGVGYFEVTAPIIQQTGSTQFTFQAAPESGALIYVDYSYYL